MRQIAQIALTRTEAERQQYGTWTGWERGYTHIDLESGERSGDG